MMIAAMMTRPNIMSKCSCNKSHKKHCSSIPNLPQTSTLSADTLFAIAQGVTAKSVSLATLEKYLISYISPPDNMPDKIVEVNADYEMDGSEDIVICHGDLTVTYEPKADNIKDHKIRAVSGTVNLLSDAATTETAILIAGQAVNSIYSTISDAWLDI